MRKPLLAVLRRQYLQINDDNNWRTSEYNGFAGHRRSRFPRMCAFDMSRDIVFSVPLPLSCTGLIARSAARSESEAFPSRAERNTKADEIAGFRLRCLRMRGISRRFCKLMILCHKLKTLILIAPTKSFAAGSCSRASLQFFLFHCSRSHVRCYTFGDRARLRPAFLGLDCSKLRLRAGRAGNRGVPPE